MLEGLKGRVAAAAGGRDIAVPGGMCAEVARTRSHLVPAARGKLVEPHEQIGYKQGAVRVSGQVWCSFF